MAIKPSVSITYCQVCGFRSRAAWLAQELLAANEEDIAGFTLVPGRGGIFEVRINDELVFSHEQAGRFPEPRELKDAVRAARGRNLLPDTTRLTSSPSTQAHYCGRPTDFRSSAVTSIERSPDNRGD